MNQVTHTCLGIRAIGLLEDAHEDPRLIELLKTKVNKTSLGAWMPDLMEARMGSGKIDNHVFKLLPMPENDPYFVVKKEVLLNTLGCDRMIVGYLEKDTTLDSDWWNRSYKAKPSPGQHLGNRASALAVAIADLLILGDNELSELVPGSISFRDSLDMEVQTRTEQAGLYFFMLSHFIADACMPMHCDARKMNGFADHYLHHQWEEHWSDKLPNLFKKEKILVSTLMADELIQESKLLDAAFGINFANSIPKLERNTDLWKEIIMMCRGSYALSCIVNPLSMPFDIEQTGKSFAELMSTAEGKTLVAEIDAVVMHDAVLSIAIIWKHIWDKFKTKEEGQ